MTDSILQLMFPLSNDEHNVNRKLDHQTSTKVNLVTNEVSLDGSDVSYGSKQNSHLAPISKSKDGSKSFSFLISDQENVEPFHYRNLLFQCALTVAANKSSIPMGQAKNGTVTIITPKKWDTLPDCYVLGMRISSDNIEKIMISNRIKFIYPKTYEELIIYLTSLHSKTQQNQTMYILENAEYFLSTNEKKYIQRTTNNFNDTINANETSVNIYENNPINSEKQSQMLTKLLAVIHNFLSIENSRYSMNDSLASEDMISQEQTNGPVCRFIVNVTTSLSQIVSRSQQLKLFLWVDEVWIISKENSKNDLLRDKSSKLKKQNNQQYDMSCTNVRPDFKERKLIFYYDIGLKSYAFKKWDVV